MILPDVNVLVYAHREDAVDHTRYRQWLEGILQSGQPYGISELVLSGFLRVVTHPRIFTPPSPIRPALDFGAADSRAAELPRYCARFPPLANLHRPVPITLCYRQSRARCLVRRTGHRIRLRMDYNGSALRTISRLALAAPTHRKSLWINRAVCSTCVFRASTPFCLPWGSKCVLPRLETWEKTGLVELLH